MTDLPEAPGDAAAPTGTRRRGAVLTRAIFLATLEELGRTSFEELSFDKIAPLAGTGKAALYRRWSTPAELVLAALTDPVTGFSSPDRPGTGTLRGDLGVLLIDFSRVLQEPRGKALRPLMTQRPRHPELYAEVHDSVVAPYLRVMLDTLRAAVDRGEAAPRAVTPRIAAVGPRMVIAESMERGTLDESEVWAIVDEVLMPLVRP